MRKYITMKLGLVITLVAGSVALATAAPTSASGGSPEPHSGGYLGVHIDDVTPQTASRLKLSDASGALVTYVDQDGPAGRAGLKNNDVIVGFNGSKVQTPEQLADLIHATAPGKTVKVTVVRDGQKKDIDVTLGAWPNAVGHARALPPGSVMAFAPPAFAPPDIDVPSFTALSSRHGLMVESLCPQLSDFFGVPRGQGVLVRSVEMGSPAEAAGLKAGDVIVKVNNETVHDMADWRRAMHARAGKIQVSVVRDKHEQTLVLSLPGRADTSRLQDQDWQGFAGQMQAFQQEMDKLGSEIARGQAETLATIKPSQQELEQMRQEIERSMKLSQKDIEKMQEEIRKSIPSQQELQQLIQKSIPSQQELQSQIEKAMKLKQEDLEKMQKEIQRSVPSQQELQELIQKSLKQQMDPEKLQQQIQKSIPSQEELQQQVQKSMELMQKDLEKLQHLSPPGDQP